MRMWSIKCRQAHLTALAAALAISAFTSPGLAEQIERATRPEEGCRLLVEGKTEGAVQQAYCAGVAHAMIVLGGSLGLCIPRTISVRELAAQINLFLTGRDDRYTGSLPEIARDAISEKWPCT